MTPIIEAAILIAALAFAVERISKTDWGRALSQRILFPTRRSPR